MQLQSLRIQAGTNRLETGYLSRCQRKTTLDRTMLCANWRGVALYLPPEKYWQ